MEIVIQNLTPLSYNSKDAKNKAAYQSKICSALTRKYKGSVPMFPADKELYARVYFFTNNGVNFDCDNISKPVWDAVNGLLYVDDRKIVLRTAAVIDYNSTFTICTPAFSDAEMYDFIWDDSKGVKVAVQNYTF